MGYFSDALKEKYTVVRRSKKYNNTIVKYNNIIFHSILEMRCYIALKEMCLKNRCKLTLQVPYTIGLKRRYIADFVIKALSINKELIIDAKGFETPLFRIKKQKMSLLGHTVHCAKTPIEAKSILLRYINLKI